jgi:hypothetical protein
MAAAELGDLGVEAQLLPRAQHRRAHPGAAGVGRGRARMGACAGSGSSCVTPTQLPTAPAAQARPQHPPSCAHPSFPQASQPPSPTPSLVVGSPQLLDDLCQLAVGARRVHYKRRLRRRRPERDGASAVLRRGGVGGRERVWAARAEPASAAACCLWSVPLPPFANPRPPTAVARTLRAHASRHASVAHSRHSVLPVPVGLSSSAFSSCSRWQRVEGDARGVGRWPAADGGGGARARAACAARAVPAAPRGPGAGAADLSRYGRHRNGGRTCSSAKITLRMYSTCGAGGAVRGRGATLPSAAPRRAPGRRRPRGESPRGRPRCRRPASVWRDRGGRRRAAGGGRRAAGGGRRAAGGGRRALRQARGGSPARRGRAAPAQPPTPGGPAAQSAIKRGPACALGFGGATSDRRPRAKSQIRREEGWEGAASGGCALWFSYI